MKSIFEELASCFSLASTACSCVSIQGKGMFSGSAFKSLKNVVVLLNKHMLLRSK